MSEQKVVELEPVVLSERRNSSHDHSDRLKKAELRDIMAPELIILASAVGEVILRGLEMQDKRKERRLLITIVILLAAVLGLVRLAIIKANS